MPPKSPSAKRGRLLLRILRFVAVRLVVWGGVFGLVVFLLGDFRFAMSPTAPLGSAASSGASGTPPVAVPEVSATDLIGQRWPHLRGPHYSGVSEETGLCDAWPRAGPPVLWVREMGRGYSGFAAVDRRIYTQAQDAYGQRVLCLDADTGRTLWEHRYAWPYDAAGMYPGPRATPTWHDERLYFAGPRGLVGCLRAKEGTPIWTVNVMEKFGGRGMHFGYACSPLVIDGKVILPVGGRGASMVALDARDGSTVWTSGDEPGSYCSAIPITIGDQRHVVAFMQNALVACDLPTGRLLWKRSFSSGYDEHSAFPVYEEPHLMVSGPFRSGSEMVRIELRPGEAQGDPPGASAERVWFSRRMSNDVASSVGLGGFVYGFDLRDIQSKAQRPSRGKFLCMELATGEVPWATESVGHASLIIADGKLILFNDRGEVILARASPAKYEELARTAVFHDEICWTAPALHRKRLYVRSPSRAACLYLGELEELERVWRNAARPASELPGPRRFDFTSLLGGEREYPADRPGAGVLVRWYATCLWAVFGVAAAVAGIAYLLGRLAWPSVARGISRGLFWTVAFACGLGATAVLNRHGSTYVFTWPASLMVVHQAALVAILFFGQPERRARYWWMSAMAGLAFLAVSIAYFHAMRTLALAAEWLFLLGFIPSWPVAVPVAYRLGRNVHPLEDIFWAYLAFTAYYGACAGFLLWLPG